MRYVNEGQWDRVVAIARDRWDTCLFKDELLRSTGEDLQLAKVIFMIHCSYSLSFMKEQVEALAWRTPEQCVKEGMRDLLRVVLLSSPI